MFILHLFCVISMFVSEKNTYIKDLNTLRILMNFICIYLGEKGGGCTNTCICMETQSICMGIHSRLFYRTA